MISSFAPDSALSLGRINQVRVRCVTVNLGCLRIAGNLSTPLLFHAIRDCTSILSFSVATRATTRALPPNLRGVCWSTGLLYRPPWWQLILLICHRLIDSCHYSVCKRENHNMLLNTQISPETRHLFSPLVFTRNYDWQTQSNKNRKIHIQSPNVMYVLKNNLEQRNFSKVSMNVTLLETGE